MKTATAHEIAADPDLYGRVWKVGKLEMECAGYSRNGQTVRFFDVAPSEYKFLDATVRYVHPDRVLEEAT